MFLSVNHRNIPALLTQENCIEKIHMKLDKGHRLKHQHSPNVPGPVIDGSFIHSVLDSHPFCFVSVRFADGKDVIASVHDKAFFHGVQLISIVKSDQRMG